jgi:hypothetical protein
MVCIPWPHYAAGTLSPHLTSCAKRIANSATIMSAQFHNF